MAQRQGDTNDRCMECLPPSVGASAAIRWPPPKSPAPFDSRGIDSRAPTAESGKGADRSGVIADHAVAPSAETGVRDEPGQRRCKNDSGYGAEPRPSRG